MPFAAQSLELPEPYSLPASTSSGVPSPWYCMAASYMEVCSPVGRYSVQLPSLPSTSLFLMRMFPNVPRIMISWLPRRDPNVLNSTGFTPWSVSHSAAGLSFGIAPAGEI